MRVNTLHSCGSSSIASVLKIYGFVRLTQVVQNSTKMTEFSIENLVFSSTLLQKGEMKGKKVQKWIKNPINLGHYNYS